MLDYTNRAASYDKRWQSYCLASFSRSLDLIHLERDEELLDIACGTGIFLEKVEREHPYVTLTGVDSNQAMLNEAVKKVSEKVILKKEKADQLSFHTEKFDWVVLSNCIGHFDDQEQCLKEAYRVLKKSGKIIVTDWTQDYIMMRFANFYTKTFDYKNYNSLYSHEIESMLTRLKFNILRTETFRINWFWSASTIMGVKS